MKKLDWLMLALFGAAAAGLRMMQMRTGFDEAGLPVAGSLYALLLPCVLVAAAVYFIVSARTLPAQRDMTAPFSDCFLFQDNAAVVGAVSGSLLLPVSAAAAIAGYAGEVRLNYLAPLAAVSAACILYVVFSLYRGSEVKAAVMLVPVLCFAVYFVLFYRADATNPILMENYVKILAAAALLYGLQELAAFAFRDGAPRVCVPVNAMALILSLAVAAERQSIASVLLFVGFALIELGFLAAADFRR